VSEWFLKIQIVLHRKLSVSPLQNKPVNSAQGNRDGLSWELLPKHKNEIY
jgi:hypothetical protein